MGEEAQACTIDRAFCQRDEVAPLGRRLLADAARDCGASAAALWVISHDQEHLDAALGCGPKAELLEQMSVPVSDSVVGMVGATGSATSIGPGDFHNQSVDEKLGTKTEAMVAVPLYVDGHLSGVISAINPVAGGLFADEHLDVLQWKSFLLGLILKGCCDSDAALD